MTRRHASLDSPIDYASLPDNLSTRIKSALEGGCFQKYNKPLQRLKEPLTTYRGIVDYLSGDECTIEDNLMRLTGIGEKAASALAKDLKNKGILKHIQEPQYR